MWPIPGRELRAYFEREKSKLQELLVRGKFQNKKEKVSVH
jgi:hypothetical protein